MNMRTKNVLTVFILSWIFLYLFTNPIFAMDKELIFKGFNKEDYVYLVTHWNNMDPYKRQLIEDLYVVYGLDPAFIPTVQKRFALAIISISGDGGNNIMDSGFKNLLNDPSRKLYNNEQMYHAMIQNINPQQFTDLSFDFHRAYLKYAGLNGTNPYGSLNEFIRTSSQRHFNGLDKFCHIDYTFKNSLVKYKVLIETKEGYESTRLRINFH